MTELPDAVQAWLREHGYGSIQRVETVGGGCINQAFRVYTQQGTVFLKVNEHGPQDMFHCEAAGLRFLNVPEGPKLPEPFLWTETFLLMEDLQPGPQRKDYWEQFGRQLAHLHTHTHTHFGLDHDNYIGTTPQPNPWTEDGYTFFAQHRLMYQARMAHRRGLLSTADLQKVERLAEQLKKWIPPQPPSRIHGDLWSGNVTTTRNGAPAIVDPAAHYGWAEADLAMTALFGVFPERFYRSYQEVRPLDSGWPERFPIYNLYHLLNHLNLFGTAYLPEIQQVLKRFVG